MGESKPKILSSLDSDSRRILEQRDFEREDELCSMLNQVSIDSGNSFFFFFYLFNFKRPMCYLLLFTDYLFSLRFRFTNLFSKTIKIFAFFGYGNRVITLLLVIIVGVFFFF